MKRYFSRDLVIGIGIGFILSSFLVLFFNPVRNDVYQKESSVKESLPLKADSEPKQLESPKVQEEEKAEIIPVTKKVVIPPGADSERIIALLLDNGIIVSAEDFRRAVNASGLDNRLRAGTFILQENMTDLDELIHILISEPHEE